MWNRFLHLRDKVEMNIGYYHGQTSLNVFEVNLSGIQSEIDTVSI